MPFHKRVILAGASLRVALCKGRSGIVSAILRGHGLSSPLILLVYAASLQAAPNAVADAAQSEQNPVTATQDLFWDDAAPALSAEDKEAVVEADCPIVSDMMEAPPSSDNWDIGRMKPRQRFTIQSVERREGQRALAISLLKDDQPNSNKKHKHELWISNKKRCHFGDEVWYSFSFRIDGTYPQSGSTRWVIGQWKEETGGSPFLAQRFDNGVFHISIQRDTTREIIATAPGDYGADFLFLSKNFQDSLPLARGTAPEGFDIMAQAQEFGPEAFEIEALREAIIDQDIDQFPFVADPENFGRLAGVLIEPSENPLLPNPTAAWVDMRYRVRGDREGNGLIEVWANEKFIVRVTGKIGNNEYEGPTQYFKIGHYRDVDQEFERSTLYFDRFRRGTDKSDVD